MNSRSTTTAANRTRPVRSRLGRAVRWVDAWTLEAFNPVYPHRRGR
ncbi:hypothetical protein JOF53_005681 [Crossiella equi]|uniref:Uncharacterized protein n=1 Tax=Crossiella equi TaxID=130796 RepID=A0ABS5AJQ4_9PSEU|nr:hypothetical protein [Crossiella equi]MBP2476809.1 hypothetical protein [Crossiella equi]